MAVFAAIDVKTLDESAASLGALAVAALSRRDRAQCRPGILAGSLMVVTLSLGEFNLTWMLHTPLTKTLPVGLADSYASMRLEVASAYTLVFFVMIIPLLVAMQMFAAIAARTAERGDERSMTAASRCALERCGKTFARRHPRARAGDARHRARRDGGVPRARPAAARPRRCGSSPGWRRRTPAAACCSTATT